MREVLSRDIQLEPGQITTLHARCKRALAAPEPAESLALDFAERYPAYAREGQIPRKFLKRLNKSEDTPLPERVLSGASEDTYYDRCYLLRNNMVPRDQWPAHLRDWYEKGWWKWCQETALDYTGWLETCLESGALPPQQHVYADEAQDFTPLQLAVLKHWDARHLTLIGDDDQNLYEWAGSDPDGFINPPLGPEHEQVLAQSYRVPAAVLDFSTRWIKRVRGRKAKIYLPRNAEGQVVRVLYGPSAAKQDWLPPGLTRAIEEGRSVMLLTSCGYMLDHLLPALHRAGIAFHNPYRTSNSVWNPLQAAGARIQAYLAIRQRMWTGAEVHQWLGALEPEVIENRGYTKFMDLCQAVGKAQVPTEFVTDKMPERLRALAAAGDLSLLRDHRRPKVPRNWDFALEQYANGKPEPRVIVGTIHSVKGGEADQVYLFPNLSAAGYQEYMGSDCDRVHRLFYVGMTRARDTLVLCENTEKYTVDW
jgi:DNA helicase II / ATP-dependent DNA helicase PcrA